MLPADDEHEREAHQQEEHAGEPVLEADDLVVCGEDVLAEQPLEDIQKRPKAKGEREMTLAACPDPRPIGRYGNQGRSIAHNNRACLEERRH